MNLRELLEEIEEAIAALDNESDAENVEVRLATQPNYPLAFELDTITLEINRPSGASKVLWLAESGHPRGNGESPYAPQCAWEGGEVDASESEEES